MKELIFKFKQLFNESFPFCNTYYPSVLSSIAMKNDVGIKYGVGIKASSAISVKSEDVEVFVIPRISGQPQIYPSFQSYAFFDSILKNLLINFGVSFLTPNAKDDHTISMAIYNNRERFTLKLKEVTENIPDPNDPNETILVEKFIWTYGDFEADSINDETLQWSQGELDLSKVFEELLMREKESGSITVKIIIENNVSGDFLEKEIFVFVENEQFDSEQDFCISDMEIEEALLQAKNQFRGNCLKLDDQETAMLYLTAHILALGLRNQTGSQFSESSRSVGSVSVSYDIPESIKGNPYLSNLFQTGFGSQYYLMIQSCVNSLPFVMCGRTTP